MTYSLIVDTSTEQGVVALAEQDRILWEEYLPQGLHNSRYVMPAIEKGCALCGLCPNDLAFAAAGIGPGSYTGIRVAAAVIQTIAFAREIPLIGVSTLDGFSPNKDGIFFVLLDAKIGGVYLLKAVKEGLNKRHLGSPKAVPLEDLFGVLGNKALLITPHETSLKARIEKQYPGHHWTFQKVGVSAKLLAASAYDKFSRKDFSLSGNLELQYLRMTQAEIEKRGNMGDQLSPS